MESKDYAESDKQLGETWFCLHCFLYMRRNLVWSVGSLSSVCACCKYSTRVSSNCADTGELVQALQSKIRRWRAGMHATRSTDLCQTGHMKKRQISVVSSGLILMVASLVLGAVTTYFWIHPIVLEVRPDCGHFVANGQ